MRVRYNAQGKFYTIECPEGTRVVHLSQQPGEGEAVLHDDLIVPLKSQQFHIPADPPELLPMVAETGNFGVSLVGEPVPEGRLAGVACRGCGAEDVTWLQLRDDSVTVHCDRCGADFAVAVATIPSVTPLRQPGR
jgi:ribosomal protein S27E